MTTAAEGLTLAQIRARLGGEIHGDASTRVSRVAPIEDADAAAITFLANPKYRSRLATTRAGAVILAESERGHCPVPAIVHANPYLYFARVSALLNPPEAVAPGIHPSAVIEPGAQVAPSASVGPHAVVGRDARVGERCVIGAGCVLGNRVQVGDDCLLHPRVVIYADCVLSARVILHSGVVVGADGFGIARDGERWEKIPQVGRVLIGDDVEVGANTTIDRGAMGDTVIEEGVKLDNQIQVGHNVHIGAHSAMAGCVGIAGSAKIGRACTVGGAAVILGHLSIADNVNISAGTLVSHSIRKAGTWSGPFPVDEHSAWLRNAAQLRRLGQLADRVRELERIIAALKKD